VEVKFQEVQVIEKVLVVEGLQEQEELHVILQELQVLVEQVQQQVSQRVQ
tara:strand:- start:231 stop:380 length:150 start_codon:yes stop_codon:yes gene_type:complete